MTERCVLDVGNCGPDHGAIKRMLQTNFNATVLQSHGLDDTLQILRTKKVDLVLINRKLDQDYSDGVEILKQIKADSAIAAVPVMIITNYEEHQNNAVALGAVYGFGKLEINSAATKEKLSKLLAPAPQPSR